MEMEMGMGGGEWHRDMTKYAGGPAMMHCLDVTVGDRGVSFNK